jgi:lipoprotein-anchoring transpeptidase ErfK/SrfK
MLIRKLATFFIFLAGLLVLAQPAAKAFDFGPEIYVSVRDQELAVVKNNETVGKYPISTSKFGVGDSFGSYKTPAGTLWVCNKIGDRLPAGAVIKNRNATGEVLKPNAPGRDPIVTRVIWLRGLDGGTQNAYARCIYIHGTPEEHNLGKPASYGCIRMRSKDVIALYELVRVGTHVTISEKSLASLLPADNSGWLSASN